MLLMMCADEVHDNSKDVVEVKDNSQDVDKVQDTKSRIILEMMKWREIPKIY